MLELYFRTNTFTLGPDREIYIVGKRKVIFLSHFWNCWPFSRFKFVESAQRQIHTRSLSLPHIFTPLATFQNRSSTNGTQDVKNIYCELVTSSRYSFSFRCYFFAPFFRTHFLYLSLSHRFPFACRISLYRFIFCRLFVVICSTSWCELFACMQGT